MATARRMGLEERGAALVSDLLFWIRIALPLSRNQAGWLGPVGVFSSHFLVLSCWSFICMFAVVPFFEPFRRMQVSNIKQLASFVASIAVAALLVVIVIKMLRHPYDIHRYGAVQLITAIAAFGGLLLAVEIIRAYRGKTPVVPNSPIRETGPRHVMVLSIFPILALVHLSIGVGDRKYTLYIPFVLGTAPIYPLSNRRRCR
jgi:hypothetical protein